MKVTTCHIPGVLLIKPTVFEDNRGIFYESFSQKKYQEIGISEVFVQDNISVSQQHVLRGMHYQQRFPQGKLVSVLEGQINDVVIDLRSDSESFGSYFGVKLDDVAREQLYVPPGCAHGFYVPGQRAIVNYKCTEYYHPEDEAGIAWNDPKINIEWPFEAPPIVSNKDNLYPLFEQQNLGER